MDGEAIVQAARDALNAASSRCALHFNDQRLTWGDLRSVAERLDRGLSQAGLGPDAPVALVLRNRPAFYAALIGLLAQRRPIVMVHSYQSPAAIAKDVRRKSPAAVVADVQDWSPELAAATHEVGACGISLHGDGDRVAMVPGLDRISGPAAEQHMEAQIVLLTSGTTGHPKSCPMSYGVLARSMLGESMMIPESGASEAPSALLYYPLAVLSGIYGFIPTIAQQRTAVLLEKFTLEAWVHFVKTWRPESVTIPTVGVRMLLDAGIPREDLRSLKFIWSGAAPMDPRAHLAFEEAYGVPILIGYGATEFAGAVTSVTLEDRRRWGTTKIASIGRPWGQNSVRVVDPDSGVELAPEAIGVLEVRAPAVGPNWIRTTDLGRIDEDGFVYHCGRSDGAINRGGFKIVPAVVEQVLALHPAVLAAAVVGLPDVRLGEIPAAAVELRPGVAAPTQEELARHVREHLPATHVPVWFQIVPNLPRTESVKPSIPEIRALLLDARSGWKTSP